MVKFMKKGKLFLLLSLLGLVIPASVGTASFSAHADEGSSNSEYSGTDTGTGDPDISSIEEGHFDIKYEETCEYYDITRIYEGHHIGNIQENFRAPSGCVLSIEADWNYLLDVETEVCLHDYFKEKSTFSMVNVAIYRNINGSKMYSDSTNAWEVNTYDLANYVTNNISSLELYEINEKISDVDVSATIEISLYTSIPDYEWSVGMTLVFEVEPYHVKKYVPGDILSLEAGFYDERIAVRANLDENLFNKKYGFKTDGRVQSEWDEELYFENYLVQYFDKATNIILDTDDAFDTTPGIELESMPTTPLTVFALLTFKAGGVEYKFYSNEVVIKNPVVGLLIDGYNNRESVGKNVSHKLRLNVDVNYEEITSAWFRVSLQGTDYEICNNVCEPESYWGAYRANMGRFTSVTDEFFEFNFKYDIAGEYDLLIQFRYETNSVWYDTEFELPILVTEKEEYYTPIDEALTLNYQEERIDCVAGGDAINLEAFIAEDVLNDGEEPTFEWSLSRLNVVDIKYEDNKAVVNPIGGGVVNVNVTCYGSAFGSVTKTIVFNVIGDVYAITSLNIPEGFHYSGENLTIGLNIEKYNSLMNFNPEWIVTNSKGEEVEFIDNHDCSITLEKPVQDDYTVTVLYNGVEIDSQVIEIRNVNIDKFIQNNIIWIALVTLAFMGVVIFLKVILEKKRSLVSKVEKTYKAFEKIDRNSSTAIKELGKIKFSIIAVDDYARSLNMNALNEYEKTIRYLRKSLDDIKHILRTHNSMTSEEFNQAYDQLSKHLSKAFIVAKEIEDAKDLALKNSYMANENNIAKSNEKKSK